MRNKQCEPDCVIAAGTRSGLETSKRQIILDPTHSVSPVSAIYNAESGVRQWTGAPNRPALCQPHGCAVVRIRTE